MGMAQDTACHRKGVKPFHETIRAPDPRTQDGMFNSSYRHLPHDLGLEPPVTTEGMRPEAMTGHRTNWRWLGGILLTTLIGCLLMVFSVMGALGPLNDIISPAQLAKGRDERMVAGGTLIIARKGDKLIRRANLIAARQDFKVPVQVKAGGAEVTRQAAFTRLATPLATESLGFADSVPAFNLARLVSLASEDKAASEQEIAVTQDNEVSLSLRPIGNDPRPDSGSVMRDEDALSQVHDMLTERRRDNVRSLAQAQIGASPLGQSQLAKVMRAPNEGSVLSTLTTGLGDPFSKLVVRMVPENVSLLPRQDVVLSPFSIEERIIVSKNNAATLQSLKAAGANARQAAEIIATLTRNGRANTLEGNRILKLTLQSPEAGQPKELMRVELFFDEQLVASTGRRDDGTFWPVEARDIPVQAAASETSAANEEEEDPDANSGRLTLYNSIYETARRYDIAPGVIEDIIRAVFFDVDLQRRVTPGDSLEILMANSESDASRQDLLFVSLNAAGTKRRLYRFKLPEDEVVDFFDDQGRSVKQFLLRKPIDGGELRSRFGMRRHPILRYYRLHAGVDWADRVGTPIRAAGNGTVRLAEWDSGYGRRVEIEHNFGYVTTYNHMSAFAPGIKEGVKVRQGQIIGRLGSSGLSTGPHLHYEVMINERLVDPLAIKLPRGRELAGQQLNEFKRERDMMEGVLKKAPGQSPLVAQN